MIDRQQMDPSLPPLPNEARTMTPREALIMLYSTLLGLMLGLAFFVGFGVAR